MLRKIISIRALGQNLAGLPALGLIISYGSQAGFAAYYSVPLDLISFSFSSLLNASVTLVFEMALLLFSLYLASCLTFLYYSKILWNLILDWHRQLGVVLQVILPLLLFSTFLVFDLDASFFLNRLVLYLSFSWFMFVLMSYFPKTRLSFTQALEFDLFFERTYNRAQNSAFMLVWLLFALFYTGVMLASEPRDVLTDDSTNERIIFISGENVVLTELDRATYLKNPQFRIVKLSDVSEMTLSVQEW